jgi:hypothetical protein
MTDETALRALERLRGDASPFRRELASLLVDGLLARPLHALVEAEGLATLLGDALTEAQAKRVAEEHLRPAIDRHRARAHEAGETLGDLLPSDVRARIEALAEGARWPEALLARELVDAERVRELVAPVLQDTLVRFARKLSVPGAGDEGGGAGLAGKVRRGLGEGASRLADVGLSVGKSVMGGFDRKLQSVAKDFSQGALREMREAMKARLESEEGRAILRALGDHAAAKLAQIPTGELLGLLDAVPREPLEELAIAVALHNTARDPFRRALREEVAAALAIEGEKPLEALLEESGTLEVVRAFLLARADHLLEGVVGQEAFGTFLGRLLG